MICEQGDIVSINFDPSLRHEPAGRHYAVVISPWEVNRMSALTWVAGNVQFLAHFASGIAPR